MGKTSHNMEKYVTPVQRWKDPSISIFIIIGLRGSKIEKAPFLKVLKYLLLVVVPSGKITNLYKIISL